MTKITSTSINVFSSHQLEVDKGDIYTCTEGHILTQHGYVMVWQADDTNPEDSFVNFEILHAGRQYFMQLQKAFTVRGLVMHARKFANRVITEKSAS